MMTVMLRGARWAPLLLLTLLAWAPQALASPVELFGGSPRSSALVGAISADARGAEALHYNPGSLALAVPGLSIGFAYSQDRARVLLKDRPAGYDIPNIGGVGPAVPTNRELNRRSDTDGLGSLSLLQIGWVASPAIDRLRVAVFAVVPLHNGAGQPTWFVDERERLFSNQLRYELLGERVRRFDLQFGFAYRMTDRLSIGAGASFLPKVTTQNDVYLPDAAEQDRVDIAVRAQQSAALGLRAGVHYDVADWLNLGVSWRSSLSLRLTGGNELRIRGFEEDPDTWPLNQTLDLTPFYSPTEYTAAASLKFGRWRLNPEASFVRWSSYRDRQSDEAGFSNIFSPRLGVEYSYSDDLRVRTGLAWTPSPVPDQVGRTNYVDNHRITIGFGAEHDISVFGSDIVVSWFGQFHQLLRRDTDKAVLDSYPNCAPGVRDLCDELPDDTIDPRTRQTLLEAQGLQTGNPGFPGFVSGGWIAAAGVQVSWPF